jgi:hypothetical protein
MGGTGCQGKLDTRSYNKQGKHRALVVRLGRAWLLVFMDLTAEGNLLYD